MKLELLAALAVLALTAAFDPKGDDVKAEMKKLEGTWRGVSDVVDGKKLPPKDSEEIALTIKADGAWTLKVGNETAHGTYTVDPSKKPKTANFVILSGRFKDNTFLDIYELDADTITFCFVTVPTGKELTKERPSRFASEKGSGHTLSVMKREKAK
jgi:uncharacterized protein (TIGR03067 family)